MDNPIANPPTISTEIEISMAAKTEIPTILISSDDSSLLPLSATQHKTSWIY
jgi:hypothetical protein